MNDKQIAILLHGPYSGNWYSRIVKVLRQVKSQYSKSIIVPVIYENDEENYDMIINKLHAENLGIKKVVVKDLLNPGYYNINRQLLTVNAGLDAIPDDYIVFKLRNDQVVSFKKVVKIINKLKWFSEERLPRIITTNCYTRPDRKYHPSDMFLCAPKAELKLYYDMPIFEQTHMDKVLELIEHYNNTHDEMISFFECPENMLFQNYLRHKNWVFKNTKEDSFEAIKKYCYVANSWDIDFKWVKKRTPILPAKSLILPYSVFIVAPFGGMPAEHIACYSRSDFDSITTLKDRFYLSFSKICFSYEYGDSPFSKPQIRKKVYSFGNHIPYKLKRIMKKTWIYSWYKKMSASL